MYGRLATVTTRDHVRLHGFHAAASEFSERPGWGVAFLHGLGGNFYGSPLLSTIAQRLYDAGHLVALANTRGHDLLNWTPCAGRSRVIGAATEDVGDAIQDVAAWVEFLREQGAARVALIGHSLGAIKALYAQADPSASAVQTVIALSATRLNHERFLLGPKGAEFQRSFAEAEHLTVQGQGDQLIRIEFPFPTWMSAEGYVHKYGRHDQYDWFGYVDRIDVPVLMLFGQRELADHPAFDGLAADLANSAARGRWPRLTFEIVPNADHFYVACYRQVAERCAAWLDELT